MKYLIIIFFLFVTNTWAEETNCKQGSFENNDLGIALLHFTSLEGRYKIGSCFVEIKYCESPTVNEDAASRFVGDVFVVDSDGDERYIPIYLTKSKTKKSHGILKRTNRTFIYRFKDKMLMMSVEIMNGLIWK